MIAMGLGINMTRAGSGMSPTLFIDFTTGVLDSRITFTRGGPATYFGSDGLLKTRGYNLLTYSTTPGGTGWNIYGTLSATQNYVSSPTGSVGQATRLIWTTPGASYTVSYSGIFTIVAGTVYTVSAYIKDNSGSSAPFFIYLGDGGSANTLRMSITSSTGGVVASIQGTATATGTTSTALGNGWYRVSVTGSFSAGVLGFGFVSAGGANGDVSIDGFQIEVGSVASTYSPTTSAANSGPRFDYDPSTPAVGGYGPELVANGNFASGSTGWAVTGAFVVSGGYLNGSGGVGEIMQVTPTLTIGNTYRVTFQAANSSLINILLGGTYATGTYANGTWTAVGVCTNNGYFHLQGGSPYSGITNISVTEVIPATNGVELAPALTSTAGWPNNSVGAGTLSVANGLMSLSYTDGSNFGKTVGTAFCTQGKTYRVKGTVAGNPVYFGVAGGGGNQGVGDFSFLFVFPAGAQTYIQIQPLTGPATLSNISIQEVVFTPRGLLIEEQRANLLLWSRDMTQASWARGEVTVAKTAIGLDGVANSATLLIPTTAATGHNVSQGIAGLGSSGLTYTVSAVVKAAGYTAFSIANATQTKGIDVNLTTMVVTALGGVAGSCTDVGGGFRRLSFTALGTDFSDSNVYFFPNGRGSTAGNGTSGFVFDNAQLEVGAAASTPIATTTQAVTRAADIAQITGTNFSSWYNSLAGTFVAEFDTLSSKYPRIVNDTTSVKTPLYADMSATRVVGMYDGTAALLTSNAVTAGSTVKAGSAYSGTTGVVASNGGAIATGNQTTGYGMNGVFLGQSNIADNYLNGHIRSIKYFNTRLPDATLQRLTAP